MFIGSQLGMIAGAGFAPLAADFDGTNDSMARGAALTGIANSYTGILSFWLRLDGGDGASQMVCQTGPDDYIQILRNASNKMRVTLQNGGSGVYIFETVSTYTASATWRHFLASWDSTGGGTSHLYVNDVSDKTVISGSTGAIITLGSSTNFYICIDTIAGRRVNGALTELYFAPAQYLDFSIESNRRKFISSDGKPVDLGATGSTPTGTAPIAYQTVRAGGVATDMATNRGTGGNFTITGTLDLITPSPWA